MPYPQAHAQSNSASSSVFTNMSVTDQEDQEAEDQEAEALERHCDVAGDPPRLIHRQRLGYVSTGFCLTPIDVSERLAGRI